MPALTSVEYAEAYNEVKSVGRIDSTTRTPEQGHIARTFSGNFRGQFNRLIRELSAAHIGGSDLASLGDRARLFALANTASADAIICAWSAKKTFNFCRPDRAIPGGDTDGNYLTDPDYSQPGPARRQLRFQELPDADQVVLQHSVMVSAP